MAADKREPEKNERQDRALQQQNEVMVALMKHQQQKQQHEMENLQAIFLNQQQQKIQALMAFWKQM